MPYHHLTQEDRYKISHMKLANFTQAEIAHELGRHPATISRELKRNSPPGFEHYLYDVAEDQAQQRRTRANQRYKLDAGKLGDVVRERLRQTWSPEQIAGRLKADHPDDAAMHVSHEAILSMGLPPPR